MSYGKYDGKLIDGSSTPVSQFQYQERQRQFLNEFFNNHLKGKIHVNTAEQAYSYKSIDYIGEQDRYLYHATDTFKSIRADISEYRTMRKRVDTELPLQKRKREVCQFIVKRLDMWKPSISWNVELGEPYANAITSNYKAPVDFHVKCGWAKAIWSKGLDVVSDKFVMKLDDIESIDSFEGAKMCKATVLTVSNVKDSYVPVKCTMEDMYLSWLVIDDQFTKMGRPYTGLGKSARTSQAALKRSVLGAIKKEML